MITRLCTGSTQCSGRLPDKLNQDPDKGESKTWWFIQISNLFHTVQLQLLTNQNPLCLLYINCARQFRKKILKQETVHLCSRQDNCINDVYHYIQLCEYVLSEDFLK